MSPMVPEAAPQGTRSLCDRSHGLGELLAPDAAAEMPAVPDRDLPARARGDRGHELAHPPAPAAHPRAVDEEALAPVVRGVAEPDADHATRAAADPPRDGQVPALELRLG